MYLDLICPICGEKKYCIPYDKQVAYCTNCNGQTGSIYFLRGANITQDLLNKTDIYIFYHPLKEFVRYFLGDNESFEIASKEWKYLVQILPEQVEAWYPRTFAQKIDYILLYFADHMKYDGEYVLYSVEELKNILFIKESKFKSENLAIIIRQVRYILEYLIKMEYIDTGLIDKNKSLCVLRPMATLKDSQYISLTPKALARVDELQKTLKDTKQVFIAMSFDKSLDKANKAIQKAISDNGYIPRRMDEYAHNNQIVPEMLYQIRQSKFIIADLTGGNNGAYYEAGYASGIGKEVILTCKQDSFASDSHFDVKQQATVIWEDEDDLKNKLTTWIEATIGKAY